MTQPPLSQSIMALEKELGAPLFTRTKRSVALTPFAQEWLPSVRAALDGVNALGETATRIQRGDAGRLELSFVSTADYNILPGLVHAFRSAYPKVELALTEATSDVQIAALLEGKGHAGIVIAHSEQALPEPLIYRCLTVEPLIAAVPESWLESGRIHRRKRTLPAASMISAPLIVFPRRVAPGFYDLVTDYYTASGGRVDIAQHAIQMQTIISLVSAGMGIALVPSSLRHLARSGVAYLELQGEVPQVETGIVWRRNDNTVTLKNFLAVADRIVL